MMLNFAKNIGKAALYQYYDIAKLFKRPYAFIHILAHPRSGSSLLVHLLASHPNICGFGESKLQYASENDLEKLPNKVLLTLRRFPRLGREKYMLDKLVHDFLLSTENSDILCSEDCRVIFLIREPHSTIRSIMRVLDYDLSRAVDYYLTRLDSLENYARVVSKAQDSIFIRYKELLYNTDEVFDLLQQFLELKEPLSEEYAILRTTGKFGYGDSSKNIFLGHIERKGHNEKTQLKQGKIGDEVDVAFKRCCIELDKLCMSIRSLS